MLLLQVWQRIYDYRIPVIISIINIIAVIVNIMQVIPQVN